LRARSAEVVIVGPNRSALNKYYALERYCDKYIMFRGGIPVSGRDLTRRKARSDWIKQLGEKVPNLVLGNEKWTIVRDLIFKYCYKQEFTLGGVEKLVMQDPQRGNVLQHDVKVALEQLRDSRCFVPKNGKSPGIDWDNGQYALDPRIETPELMEEAAQDYLFTYQVFRKSKYEGFQE